MTDAEQAHEDQMAEFTGIVQNAEPKPEDLRKLLLMNLTTDPPYQPRSLALTWMQRLPEAWRGWYPEECVRVAETMGLSEEVK